MEIMYQCAIYSLITNQKTFRVEISKLAIIHPALGICSPGHLLTIQQSAELESNNIMWKFSMPTVSWDESITLVFSG